MIVINAAERNSKRTILFMMNWYLVCSLKINDYIVSGVLLLGGGATVMPD